MSVIQDNINELRYIKRGNLHEEAKIVGNYYRDIIHSYGIDVNYYKLKSNYPTEFMIPDISASRLSAAQNVLIQHAYGIEPDPDFSISASMLTYMEVESDIFNLNKYGFIPNTDVNFYFDSVDFATKLSPKTGKSREYKLAEKSLSVYSTYYELSNVNHFNIPITFYIPELAVPISANIPLFDFGVETTKDEYTLNIKCEISQDIPAKILFPVNENLYRSFNYMISGNIPPECMYLNAHIRLLLDRKFFNLKNAYELVAAMLSEGIVDHPLSSYSEIKKETIEYNNETARLPINLVKVRDIFDYYKWLTPFMMDVSLSGSILFTDLHLMSKYKEKIVPMVGDVVTIDFPDDRNRERYQITECNDKDLSQSGLNPLLHKYVWKCKARRYVNDHETFPEENDADKHLAEKLDLVNTAAHDVGAEIEAYPNSEDKIYGGYTKKDDFKDINEYKPAKTGKLPSVGSMMTVLEFGNGSVLKTDGFDLWYFAFENDQGTQIDSEITKGNFKIDENIQFLRASKTQLVFVQLDGKVCELANAEDSSEVSNVENKLLDSLTVLTIPANGAFNPNANGDNFFKFSSSGTMLVSFKDETTGKGELYCYFKKPDGKYVKRNLA